MDRQIWIFLRFFCFFCLIEYENVFVLQWYTVIQEGGSDKFCCENGGGDRVRKEF